MKKSPSSLIPARAQRATGSRKLPIVFAACLIAALGHAQTDTTGGATPPPADTTATSTETTVTGGGTSTTGDTTTTTNMTSGSTADTKDTSAATASTDASTTTGTGTSTTTGDTSSTTTGGGTTGGTSTTTTTGTDTTTAGSGTTTGGSTTTSGGASTPTDTTTPAVIVPAITTSHADAVLTAAGGTATSTYQWRFNGAALEGKTAATLSIENVLPENTGLYSVDITDGTTTKSATTILGLASIAKIVGSAVEDGSNIVHPNGNVYDQVLLTGPAATVKADAGQVTRVSFIDVNDDIVQVEFSGAGSVSINLENASAPAAPVNYNQPDVSYIKGHATIVVTNADSTTHLAVFSVGRINAVNQSLFRGDIGYDGWANVQVVAIQSVDGKFGGIRAGNTSFLGAKGITGVYAPGVTFTAPIVVGDVTASATAMPALVLGGSTQVLLAGGDLFQVNNAAVQVSGFTQLLLKDGVTSHGSLLSAQPLSGKLMDAGVDVTSRATRN
jgi:hypothetical protein